MPAEVSAILDSSVGPNDYHRDDEQRDKVIHHYALGLVRMVGIARQAGADILFVTPASNIKDASPFKSQHIQRPEEEVRNRWVAACKRALEARKTEDYEAMVAALGEAAQIDDRWARLHYDLGKALMELGRLDEAQAAFVRARDEDVCPLRALTPMVGIVERVAAEQNVAVVDFPGRLRDTARREQGHSVLGKEYFLDHVHPTIRTHCLLAQWIIETMAAEGLMQLDSGWTEDSIQRIAEQVEASIDSEVHARGLLNLCKVLAWSGKFAEAREPALKALKLLPEDAACLLQMGLFSEHAEDWDTALSYYWRSLKKDPLNARVHRHVGRLHTKAGNLVAATAHCLMASKLRPDLAEPYFLLGKVIHDREQVSRSIPYLKKCLEIDPKHRRAQRKLSAAMATLKAQGGVPPPIATW